MSVCSICLDMFNNDVEIVATTCKHNYHKNCILPWILSSGNCPVCRRSISSNSLRRVSPNRQILRSMSNYTIHSSQGNNNMTCSSCEASLEAAVKQRLKFYKIIFTVTVGLLFAILIALLNVIKSLETEIEQLMAYIQQLESLKIDEKTKDHNSIFFYAFMCVILYCALKRLI